MKRAAAYLRVSTIAQADADRFGLEIQAVACKRYADQNGMVIVETFTDTITGTKAARAGLEDLFNRAPTFDAVVISSVDRLARRAGIAYAVLAELLETDLEVHISDVGLLDPDDESTALMFGFKAISAESDHRRIARRLNAGRIQKVVRGTPIRPLDCYGWDKGELVPLEAERVKWLFEQAESRGVMSLAGELNALQIPTPSGRGIWHSGNLLMILRNRSYMGEYLLGRPRSGRQSQRVTAACRVPPLITAEQFERTARALEGRLNNRRAKGSRRDEFPLLGSITCGVCGAALSGIRAFSANGGAKYAYRCWRSVNNRGDAGLCSHKRSYHAGKLHARVRVDLQALTISDDLLRSSVHAPRPKPVDHGADRARLVKRLENSVKMRVDGEITRDELARICSDVDTALELMDAQDATSAAPFEPDLKAARVAVREALELLPLHAIADALRLTVTVSPEDVPPGYRGFVGRFSYSLEL